MKHVSRRSGTLRTNPALDQPYESYVPADLPPDPPIDVNLEIRALLSLTHKELEHLRRTVERLPDFENFVYLCVRREAIFSSRIEGLKVTVDEMLAPDIEERGKGAAVAVHNNARAIFSAVEALQERGSPLDLEMLHNAHRVLFSQGDTSVRNPGDFRTGQNWIGPRGCSLRSAIFVPPNPRDMAKGLRALEDYMHRDSQLDPLLRAGLIHYQFETLHPFDDGNGRMRRLLTLLYLLDQEVISAPYLCPSYQLNLLRSRYYDGLKKVREEGDYETWLKFFLGIVEATAEDAMMTMMKLERVREASVAVVLENCGGAVRRAKRAAFLEYLEKKPIIEIGRTAKDMDWSFPTASKFIREFVEAGILKETSGRRRNRVFSYEAYLDIFRQGVNGEES